MDVWQALLLGLVEGLTEYLPVSSTGHLLVVQRLLGIPETEAANAFAIAIQAGAIVAVLGLYGQRVRQMLAGVAGRDGTGRRLALGLCVAFLPAAVLGFLLDDWLEAHLFGPWPIVGAWAIGGVAILALSGWITRREGSDLESRSPRQALAIGCLQCLALWPGTSRSLATILGGLFAGLSLRASVEFSFLLGLVTLGAATAYKALQHGGAMLASYGALPLGVGFAAACVSAVFAIRWMVGWLNQRGLEVFGWWRLLAAAGVGAMLAAGSLTP